MVVMKVLMKFLEAYCISKHVLPPPTRGCARLEANSHGLTRITDHQQFNLHIKVLLVRSHVLYRILFLSVIVSMNINGY